MNVEIGNEAAQFPEKENINGIFLAVLTIFTIFLYCLALKLNGSNKADDLSYAALRYFQGQNHRIGAYIWRALPLNIHLARLPFYMTMSWNESLKTMFLIFFIFIDT
jgi:hypothetical protein